MLISHQLISTKRQIDYFQSNVNSPLQMLPRSLCSPPLILLGNDSISILHGKS